MQNELVAAYEKMIQTREAYGKALKQARKTGPNEKTRKAFLMANDAWREFFKIPGADDFMEKRV